MTRTAAVSAAVCVLVLAGGAGGLGATPGAFSFDACDIRAVHGATVRRDGGNAIVLRMPSAEWSCGAKLLPLPGSGAFDFSGARYLAADVENAGTNQMRLSMFVNSVGEVPADASDHAAASLAGNKSVNTGAAIDPGETATLRIELPHPSVYLAPAGAKGRYVIDTAAVSNIEFRVNWPFEDEFRWVADCRISDLRLEGEPDFAAAVAPEDYSPFVDRFGQFVHGEWPGKVRDGAELPADLAAEEAALSPAPSDWDACGGWKTGPQLEATGSFRTLLRDGRWWLVTPSGRLFFSLGVDVLRASTDAPDGSAHPDWYETPVPSSRSMDFPSWNLALKFGTRSFGDAYRDFCFRRLDSWGLNTIGNWSDASWCASGRKPYVLSLFQRPSSIPALPGKAFYDCFDPGFGAAVTNAVASKFASDAATAASASDPMCIGYFADNELDFGSPLAAALALDADASAAKREFFSRAEAKYGTVAALNAAWGTSFGSFAAARAMKAAPASPASGWTADRNAFEEEWYRRYFRAVRGAIEAVAPDRLYLGCRFNGLRQSALLWRAASESCDVISFNSYTHSLANIPSTIAANCNPARPLLLGEFHFGTTAGGMFSGGLCPVAGQEERGRAYERLVSGALRHPLVVGCHWFQWRDQPLVGRGDGEAYGIGWVDVCDRPCAPLAAAARRVAETMYPLRNGGGAGLLCTVWNSWRDGPEGLPARREIRGLDDWDAAADGAWRHVGGAAWRVNNFYALRSGFLTAPRTGSWRFRLESDAWAVGTLGGRDLFATDKSSYPARVETSAPVPLEAGRPVPFSMLFRQGTSGSHGRFRLRWKMEETDGGGEGYLAIPDSALSTAAGPEDSLRDPFGWTDLEWGGAQPSAAFFQAPSGDVEADAADGSLAVVLVSSGSNLVCRADSGRLLARTVPADLDFDIEATVSHPTGSWWFDDEIAKGGWDANAVAAAGFMVRTGTEAGAPCVALLRTHGGGVVAETRTVPGEPPQRVARFGPGAAPEGGARNGVALAVRKRGDALVFEADGRVLAEENAKTLFGAGAAITVGFAGQSADANYDSVAVFSNVRFSAAPPPGTFLIFR